MRFKTILAILLFSSLQSFAQKFTNEEMTSIYEEVKTPYKYGMVVAPKDNYHQIDCPTVYQENGKWYMTYVCYNGKDGLDGRGYETWLAQSDDLLHWKTLGRILSYQNEGWDMNQRGGFPSLIDWNWNGSYEMMKYKGKHWMTYIGGHGTGYEAVREPLNIGMAWTKEGISSAHEWNTIGKPLMSINDKDAQWWEKLVQYKSTIYWDKNKTLGYPFVMYYNAGGINPANKMKAERIGIALSKNLKEWKRYEQNPVYFHEAPGIITGDAQIVKMGDKYVMFYFSAYNPSRRYSAYNTFSVSRDLLHWQDWEGNDLIIPSKPYDDLFAHKSYVLKHKGVVYHFYCAVDKAGQRGIAVATNVPMGRSEVAFPVPEKKGKREIVSLDKNWMVTFGKTNADSITAKLKPFQVNVPNNLDDYYGYRQLKHGNLHGSATYTKIFTTDKKSGKRYFLEFQGVGTYARVTLNNKTYERELVGRTVYTLDVTDALRQGSNQLKVEVDHPAYQTESPWICGGCSAEWGFSEGSQPFGIYRPVNLVETDCVRIQPFGVHIWNNAACDSVFIATEVKNYANESVKVQLINKLNQASGKTFFRLPIDLELAPGETRIIHQATAVKDVHRWNLDDPYLYNLATMVKRGGKSTDEISTEFGIRSISWPLHRKDGDNCFYLNGKKTFINGTCDYEHLFGGSHAFSNEQIASRVKMMRQTGFNAFREAHQPHNLYYQQLLDEQGMLFWSQFSAHIWYDTPVFRENFKRKLREYIKERRNSPSVILWGLQNESVLPKDFAEECSAIIREMDPTCRNQRAITTCNGGEGTDWNVIQNWSGTYGGDANNYANELKRPEQLLNGEYGAWRTIGLQNGDKASEEWFTNLLKLKSEKALSVQDSVCGHFQWIFVSHENPGRIQPDGAYRRIDKVGPINNKGIFTLWEQPTEAFYMYKDMFAPSADVKEMPTAADRNIDLLKGAEDYTYLYRINCGGDDYIDKYGQEWFQDDTCYSSSWSKHFGLNPFHASQGHITAKIRGTEDAPLFQYFRWGRHRLNYHFNVLDGKYRVELYFAEPWLGARYGSSIDCEGERIFDVAINDSVVVDDFDPWAEAGYAGSCKKVVEAEAKNGQLIISFPEVKAGEAVIAAIAIASKDKKVAASSELKHYCNSKSYWRDLDNDTIAQYPKELLPQDADAFPATRYTQRKLGKWEIKPGVGREYALRFRYKNTSGKPVKARMKLLDNRGMVYQDREITFPMTPKKFKILGTTTGTQINAGTYWVVIESKELEFEYLEVQ